MIGDVLSNQLAGTEKVQDVALLWAAVERDMLESVKSCEEAHGVGGIGEIPPVEKRQEALAEVISAAVAGNYRSFYVTNVLPEHVDNADRAAGYLGMDEDEWEAQIKNWAASYRQNAGVGTDLTDRDLADHHVTENFGVDSLEEFENEVVEWAEGESLRNVTRGNFDAVLDAHDRIEAAAETEGSAE